MKKIKRKLAIAFMLLAFFGCSTDSSTDDTKTEENNQNQDSEKTDDTKKDSESEDNTDNKRDDTASVTVAQYFWGEWRRMDNNEIYVIDETGVTVGSSAQNYKATSSTKESLAVSTLGTFTKQSDSVMTNGAIPYFRKGGTNLKYTMKLVGFEENVARAASSASLAGWKATGTSGTYTSYSNSADSDGEGNITLTAPTKDDVQIVTVQSGNTVVVVPGIKVENDGSNMGTIPISEAGQYSLKITGAIPDEEKDDGYLFGNNYKEYPLTLTITNVSEVTSATSVVSIEAASEGLSVRATDGSNLDATPVSTLKSGVSKTMSLSVRYGTLSKAYIDTGLNVTVKNLKTGQKWVDYVPLRFYRALVPISIAAQSTEHNSDAALNGFVIYPDGNSQFFSVPDMGSKTLLVPSFGSDKRYVLSFSGATVAGELSSSTEMFYTVAQGTRMTKDVEIPNDVSKISEYYSFGEKNDTEESAYAVTDSFEAYLEEGDIDFFSVVADSEEVILPSGKEIYSVRYVTSYGEAPAQKTVVAGESLTEDLLQTVARPYYDFVGWYIGSYRVSSTYTPTSNITLTAKWTPIEYAISYELNGGTNASENPANYTVESDAIALSEPTRAGYAFKGWYEAEDFSGNAVTTIPAGSTENRTFYAKWEIITYTISYELNGGTNASENPTSYTVESDAITLAEPTREGYGFGGWYKTVDFSDSSFTEITSGTTGDMTVYAKWIDAVLYSSDVSTFSVNGSLSVCSIKLKGIWSEENLTSLVSILKETNALINLDMSNAEADCLSNLNSDATTKCFQHFENLNSIILPNSLTGIGAWLFYGCYGLTSVVIPNKVTTIGYAAFELCIHLPSIMLPDSVTSIAAYAFYNCTELASINIPNGVTEIGYGAFYSCSIAELTIPYSVTSIGRKALYACPNLSRVVFERTSGWCAEHQYSSAYDVKLTESELSNASTAAELLKSTYKDYQWVVK